MERSPVLRRATGLIAAMALAACWSGASASAAPLASAAPSMPSAIVLAQTHVHGGGHGGHWAHGGGGHWRHGGGYWRNGQWIAAGVGLGVLGAAVAAGTYGSYGAPPAPGMCWYYTDPSRTSGFWDYCR